MNRRSTLRFAAAAAGVAVVVIAAVGVAAVRGADDATTSDDSASMSTAEAVRTDLVEETEFDGTLGRGDGESVLGRVEGVVTATPSAGDVVGNGDVLYSVDGDPVIALIGDSAAYRDLAAHPDPEPCSAVRDGVVTWLPSPGDVIEAGDIAYEIDGMPVIAIEGDVPAYRTLQDLPDAMTGDDVAQLERNLDAFGLAAPHDVTVDDTFTSATADALEALQAWVGMVDDGTLSPDEYLVIDGPTTVVEVAVEVGDRVSVGADPVFTIAPDGEAMSGPDVAALNAALVELGYLEVTGDVFDAATDAAVRALQADVGMDVDGVLSTTELQFLHAPIRVAAVAAPIGSVVAAGTVVLEATGEDVVVSVDFPASDQGLLSVGQAVTVELPDGTKVDGSVGDIATVAVSGGEDGAVFPVEVTLADATDVAGLDEAPVTVAVVSDSAVGVVAVPVAALVALLDGGYAVEIVDGTTTRLVGVEAGFFADGLVEVNGEVESGDLVVVP